MFSVLVLNFSMTWIRLLDNILSNVPSNFVALLLKRNVKNRDFQCNAEFRTVR